MTLAAIEARGPAGKRYRRAAWPDGRFVWRCPDSWLIRWESWHYGAVSTFATKRQFKIEYWTPDAGDEDADDWELRQEPGDEADPR